MRACAGLDRNTGIQSDPPAEGDYPGPSKRRCEMPGRKFFKAKDIRWDKNKARLPYHFRALPLFKMFLLETGSREVEFLQRSAELKEKVRRLWAPCSEQARGRQAEF